MSDDEHLTHGWEPDLPVEDSILRRFLFGVTPVDPPVLAAVVLLLLGVGLLAAWLPARRATRIAPWTALRGD